MRFTADLHIHSRFARATARSLTLPSIVEWAKLKGLDLVAIPDFTHPAWLKEVESQIEKDETGFYVLKKDDSLVRTQLVFSTEISAIFNRKGNIHRIHLIVVAPSLEAVREINKSLSRFGNLEADGRPVFGKDIVVLLGVIFSACPDCIVFPAHIWTPWFSLFGSRSGFDSFEECFLNFSDRIGAVETGESSDPAMNWRVKQLDTKAIVSFSDAHSQINMGREMTIFSGDFSFDGLRIALGGEDKKKSGVKKVDVKRVHKNESTRQQPVREHECRRTRIVKTIEFYPQEGKYHFTGHRNCKVVQSSEETKKYGVECPVCHRPLTVGVMHRVEELADRSEDEIGIVFEEGRVKSKLLTRPPYRRLIQLNNVIAQALMVKNSRSENVLKIYKDLCTTFGSEIDILTKVPIQEIAARSNPLIAEAIEKNRVGDVQISPGYDGVYGSITIKLSGRNATEKVEKKIEQSRLF